MLLKMKLNKKLMLLTSLVMMSLNVFSQNVTNTSLKDSTKIQLTKPIARLVIKDLIKFDGVSTEVETMQLVLTETNNKLLTQSDLVLNLKQQLNNSDGIIKEQARQLALSKELQAKLQTDLKKQKLKTKVFSGAGILAVVGVLVLTK